MEELWSELEANLGRRAPLALRALHAGAAEASLLALSARGVSADITASYRRHDGARVAGGVLGGLPCPRGAPWTRMTRWIPVETALDETARIQRRLPRLPGCIVVARFGRFQPRDVIENESQLLILADAGGALFAIFELPDDDQELELMPLDTTWREVLTSLAQVLASGAMIGAREDNIDRLEPARAPSAQPANRRPAESLVSLLAEIGALPPGTRLTEASLCGLDAALRKRKPEARAHAVLNELQRCGEVVSPRLTEEALAALLSSF